MRPAMRGIMGAGPACSCLLTTESIEAEGGRGTHPPPQRATLLQRRLDVDQARHRLLLVRTLDQPAEGLLGIIAHREKLEIALIGGRGACLLRLGPSCLICRAGLLLPRLDRAVGYPAERHGAAG